MRIKKTLIRLRGITGWFESPLGAHVRRYVFSRCDTFAPGASQCLNRKSGGVLLCFSDKSNIYESSG